MIHRGNFFGTNANREMRVEILPPRRDLGPCANAGSKNGSNTIMDSWEQTFTYQASMLKAAFCVLMPNQRMQLPLERKYQRARWTVWHRATVRDFLGSLFSDAPVSR